MVIYTTYNLPEAHIVAGRLDSEGIPAFVSQEPAGSAIGITYGRLGEVRVAVNAADYEQALAILEGEASDWLAADNDQIIFGDHDLNDDDEHRDIDDTHK